MPTIGIPVPGVNFPIYNPGLINGYFHQLINKVWRVVVIVIGQDDVICFRLLFPYFPRGMSPVIVSFAGKYKSHLGIVVFCKCVAISFFSLLSITTVAHQLGFVCAISDSSIHFKGCILSNVGTINSTFILRT